MLNIKFAKGWDDSLRSNLHHITAHMRQSAIEGNVFGGATMSWNALCARLPETQSCSSDIAHQVIEKFFQAYDKDGCIYGLFSAASKEKKKLSSFIATRSYCIRVLSCSVEGELTLNISPIYYFGPEYPEQYQKEHGEELDADAIIGLIESPVEDILETNRKSFSLGVDGGIVFKDSKIEHNKKMLLDLKMLGNGLMAALHCDSQTTSKSLAWEELGLSVSYPATQSAEVSSVLA